jgi:gliding motility-associated-like protein
MAMRREHIKNLVVLCLLAAAYWPLQAQVGEGAAVLLQNFGKGDNNINNTGMPLTAAQTEFVYTQATCPPAGGYCLARRIALDGCGSKNWIDLGSDYTSDYDVNMSNGYMMLINDTAHSQNKTVYCDTIQHPLCPAVNYTFSVAAINVTKAVQCTDGRIHHPRLRLTVENSTGTVIFADTTAPIGFSSGFMGHRFGKYAMSFTPPAGINKLVVRIAVLPTSAFCGEDFAIDDVKVAASGPAIQSSFLNEPEGVVVKAGCFQQLPVFSLAGTLTHNYPNPAYQWQQSTDDGLTWTDIAAANLTGFTRQFTQPDTLLFRFTASDASLIANIYCRVVSRWRKVEIDGPPRLSSLQNNSPVCAGEVIKINAEGAARYEWNGPNGFVENVPFPQRFNASLQDSGWYFVKLFSFGGCQSTDSTYVVVKGFDADAGPDTALCKGQAVNLYSATAQNWRWWPGTGLTDSLSANPVATPMVTTLYTVAIKDSIGCSDTAQVLISIKNKVELTAAFQSSQYVCQPVDSLYFSWKGTGAAVKWQWQFGNGQLDTLATPGVQYYYPGNTAISYPVQLTVMDTLGCTATATRLLQVVNNCNLQVPGAFTPNGDGLNDYLWPINAWKASSIWFAVFNRNGNMVFETRQWPAKWNGYYKGEPQPAGVYVWQLSYRDEAGKKITQKGTTVLIR